MYHVARVESVRLLPHWEKAIEVWVYLKTHSASVSDWRVAAMHLGECVFSYMQWCS